MFINKLDPETCLPSGRRVRDDIKILNQVQDDNVIRLSCCPPNSADQHLDCEIVMGSRNKFGMTKEDPETRITSGR
jgi:hypothetical protein